jgi:putative ABC transport system permease protein
MDQVIRDAHAAARFLFRNPSFSAVVIVTIATAIAINAAVFTGVNAVLLRPLPFQDPAGLVSITATRASDGSSGRLSWAEIDAYRTESQVFDSLGAYFRQPEHRFDADALVRFISSPVSTDFFDVLGVDAAVGRTFLSEDTSESHVVVISHGFWHRRFGGRPDILDQHLRFDNATYRVIGVMPRAFHHVDGLPAEVWTPMWPMFRPTDRRDSVVGRLRAGTSLAAAQARVAAVAAELERRYPASNAGWRSTLAPLGDASSPTLRTTLLVLLAGVGVVLLMACANVGTMLVARNLARGQEFRVRLALGAGRARLLRETAIESAILAAAGGIAGVGLTLVSVRALALLAPPTLPRLTLATIDRRVWLWTLAITCIVGVLSSVAPAIAASRVRMVEGLGDMRRATADRNARRLRASLVVVQIMLATVLVVGAGLMSRTVTNLRRTDLGFQPRHLVNVYVRPGWGVSRIGPNMAVYYQALRARIGALPGVSSVGAAKGLPLVSDVQGSEAEVRSDDAPADGRRAIAARRWFVVPGYFEALGVPLIQGRFFEPADDIEARGAAIISAGLARRLFGPQDPIGRRIVVLSPLEPHTIVGVVGDVKTSPGDPPIDTVYLTNSNVSARLTINLVVAAVGDTASIVPRIRDAVLDVEPNVAILDISTLGDAFEETLGHPRFLARLLNLFGVAGLLLAAIGVHGLASFVVAQRRREIGVRIAIGAGRRAIMALVVGDNLWIAALGTAFGIGVALATTKYLSSVLYAISPTDPVTLAAAGMVLLATAIVASYVPAQHACDVDPSELMRSE